MYTQAPRLECAVSTRPMITLPWTPSPHCIDEISVNSPWNPQTVSLIQENTTPWNPQTVSSMQEYTTPSSCQQKFFPGYNLAGGSSRSCTSEADITAAQPLTTSTYLPSRKTTGYSEQSAPRYPDTLDQLQVTLHIPNLLQDTNTSQLTQLHQRVLA